MRTATLHTQPALTTDVELHGPALIAAIVARKLATRIAERDAAQEQLRADPRPAELAAKLTRFLSECSVDLAEWVQMPLDTAARVGLAGVDVLRGIQTRAARLRERIQGAQARLDAIPGMIAGMTIDDVQNITIAVQHELLLLAEIPGEAWSEYRSLAKLLDAWEVEHVAA